MSSLHRGLDIKKIRVGHVKNQNISTESSRQREGNGQLSVNLSISNLFTKSPIQDISAVKFGMSLDFSGFNGVYALHFAAVKVLGI